MPKISIESRRIIMGFLTVVGGFYLATVIYPSSQPENKIIDLKDHQAMIVGSLSKNFYFYDELDKYEVSSATLDKWLQPYTRDYSGKQDVRFDPVKVNQYLQSLSSKIEEAPTNARLIFDGSHAQVFNPASPGKKLDVGQTFSNFTKAIEAGYSSSSIAVDYVDPEITLDKINSLGIKTLIGKGESDFSGSSSARIHNIKTGLVRFNGIILAPGEEFSFNNFLGAVEASTGYQPELVIKSGQLAKEYGGGLCQVSTTIFRAAIYAGLPILERHPHYFPVHYYNPQGFDATIYPGTTDLRFTNDTPNHILIQGKMEKNKLTFEMYGTDDGRKVEVSSPVQYDQNPNGAMKAYFNRKITLSDATVEQQRFNSKYLPPPKSPLERTPLQ